MENPTSVDTGLLILRLGLSFVFLGAAIIHTKDREGRASAAHFTSLLFPSESREGNRGIVNLCAAAAVAALYLGGLGVLLGVGVEAAAAIIFIFAACGFLIHMRDGQLASAVAEQLAQRVPDEAAAINRIRFSALVGSASSGIKNIALMGSAALLWLHGGGYYSVLRFF